MSTNHPNWAWLLTGDNDPTLVATPAPIGCLYLRHLSGLSEQFPGKLFQKIGAGDTAWIEIQRSLAPQMFAYIATGAEGALFTVPFPAPRANINYQVQLTMGRQAASGANTFKTPRLVNGSFTVNGFDVELDAAAQAGDLIFVTVLDTPL